MKTEFEDRLDNLLRTRSYSDLSIEDKKFVDENIGGQKAFERLSKITAGMSVDKEMDVSPDTKKSLVRMMKRKNESSLSVALGFKMPAYLFIIFLPIVIFITIWVSPEKTRVVERTVEIPAQPVVDTVYIDSDADTVYIERTVQIPVYVTKYLEKKVDPEPTREQPGNKSLADQEDLMELLSQSK